jgi:hypothetical protein
MTDKGGTIHPTYPAETVDGELIWYGYGGPYVHLGDEVAHKAEPGPIGVVTDIHGETFGDGTGDTITVHPAAVTLSSGDRYPVADLVLLRRAEA